MGIRRNEAFRRSILRGNFSLLHYLYYSYFEGGVLQRQKSYYTIHAIKLFFFKTIPIITPSFLMACSNEHLFLLCASVVFLTLRLRPLEYLVLGLGLRSQQPQCAINPCPGLLRHADSEQARCGASVVVFARVPPTSFFASGGGPCSCRSPFPTPSA